MSKRSGMRITWKMILGVILGLTISAGTTYALAQPTRQQAVARLEQLEAQRAQQEYHFQMGMGIAPSLRDGYAQLAADFPGESDIVEWAAYRMAEFEYSRDEFQAALQRLSGVIAQHKDKQVTLEAKLLAAEILESPFNPKRDETAAEGMLARAEQEYPDSSRARVAHAQRQAARAVKGGDFKRAGTSLSGTVSLSDFMSAAPMDSPIDRVTKGKHNEEVAKAYRHTALAQGAQGDYAGTYSTLKQLAQNYTGTDPMDYFTFTTTRQDLEFQKALALAAAGQKSEALAELRAFAAKYPDSHLSIRAIARMEQLDLRVVDQGAHTLTSAEPVEQPLPRPTEPVMAAKQATTANSSEDRACICGPSALRVALSRLGHEVPLAALIQASGASQEGTSMAGLVKAAREQGVTAFGLQVAKVDLSRVTLPAVVLLKDHYVTVTAVGPDQVTYFDPLIGWTTSPVSAFDALWDGDLILFTATEVEALHGLAGARLLTAEELATKKGRFLCGNQGGNYPGCNAPCQNFQQDGAVADGLNDGFVVTVNRVNSNNLIQSPRLILDGDDNSEIDLRLTYNSESSSANGGIAPGWTPSYSDHIVAGTNPQWVTSDGSRLTYLSNVDGTFTPPPGIADTMTKNADGSTVIVRKNRERLQFDTTGHLLSRVDHNGHGVTLAYDTQGRLSTLTGTSGITATLTYDTANRVSSVSAGLDQQVSFTYDSNNNLTQVQLPGQRSIGLGYTSNGILSSFKDSRGNTTSFSYMTFEAQTNAQQLVSKTNALGNSTVFGGPLVSTTGTIQDYAGATTNVGWDSLRRITAVTDPLSDTTSYQYTPDNRLSTVTDPLNNQTQYFYDAYGNRTTAMDALGNKTFYTYDVNNNLTSVIDALGHKTSYQYDTQGNLASVTNALGQSMLYTYDATGHLTNVTDFAGAKTVYTYSTQGWLTQVTDPLQHNTYFQYDQFGRRTAVVDNGNHTTKYTYDAAGHVIQITYPDATTESMQYSGSLLVGKTDRNGNTTTFTYDSLGRLVSIVDPTPAHGTTSFTYDADGRQTSVSDPDGHTTTTTYDAKGRVLTITRPGGVKESFTYDKADHVLTKTAPDGSTTTYTYDAIGRVVHVVRQ